MARRRIVSDLDSLVYPDRRPAGNPPASQYRYPNFEMPQPSIDRNLLQTPYAPRSAVDVPGMLPGPQQTSLAPTYQGAPQTQPFQAPSFAGMSPATFNPVAQLVQSGIQGIGQGFQLRSQLRERKGLRKSLDRPSAEGTFLRTTGRQGVAANTLAAKRGTAGALPGPSNAAGRAYLDANITNQANQAMGGIEAQAALADAQRRNAIQSEIAGVNRDIQGTQNQLIGTVAGALPRAAQAQAQGIMQENAVAQMNQQAQQQANQEAFRRYQADLAGFEAEQAGLQRAEDVGFRERQLGLQKDIFRDRRQARQEQLEAEMAAQDLVNMNAAPQDPYTNIFGSAQEGRYGVLPSGEVVQLTQPAGGQGDGGQGDGGQGDGGQGGFDPLTAGRLNDVMRGIGYNPAETSLDRFVRSIYSGNDRFRERQFRGAMLSAGFNLDLDEATIQEAINSPVLSDAAKRQEILNVINDPRGVNGATFLYRPDIQRAIEEFLNYREGPSLYEQGQEETGRAISENIGAYKGRGGAR